MLQKLPKGTQLSKRMLACIILGGGLVIATIILFITLFSPQDSAAPEKETGLKDVTQQQIAQSEAVSQDFLSSINQEPDAISSNSKNGYNQSGMPGAAETLGGEGRQGVAVIQGQPNGNGKVPSYQQAKEEGMKSPLSPGGFQAVGQQSLSSGSSSNSRGRGQRGDTVLSLQGMTEADPNDQNQKAHFLKQQSNGDNHYILEKGVQNPASSLILSQGTMIPAILQTGINSDLPGPIKALVRENVYDSITGNAVLIPQGSSLIGVYDSQVAYGQERVLIAWNRVIFPNGQYINLDGMNGVDLAGMAGLNDQVNNHYLKLFGSVAMMSLFGAAYEMTQNNSTDANGTMSNSQIMGTVVGQNIAQTGSQLSQKAMNIQPTIEIRQGDLFNVFITKDIPFEEGYAGQ